MDTISEIIFQHGWGLDRTCWHCWNDVVPVNIRRTYPDRGYFGRKRDVRSFSQERGNILISHSFGLHLLPERLIRQADMLVIFCGFDYFHPADEKKARLSGRMLALMQGYFFRDPEKVLENFYSGRVFSVEKASRDTIDLPLLESDLRRLGTQRVTLEPLLDVPHTIVFHGGKDTVVPVERGRALHRCLPGSELVIIEDGCHDLPFTHVRQCWRHLKSRFDVITNL